MDRCIHKTESTEKFKKILSRLKTNQRTTILEKQGCPETIFVYRSFIGFYNITTGTEDDEIYKPVIGRLCGWHVWMIERLLLKSVFQTNRPLSGHQPKL